MKKIFLIVITIFTLIGCSKNEDNPKNPIQEKLKGSWKEIGYYDDVDGDPITGTNYHLIENGRITIFYSNGTMDFPAYPSNPIGNYSVTIDSLLTMNFNENYTWNPNSTYIDKIYLLNEQYLELSCNQTGVMCDTYRYEKVNP